MAETAEEAEMRELEEGVARLNDAGAPLLHASDSAVAKRSLRRLIFSSSSSTAHRS